MLKFPGKRPHDLASRRQLASARAVQLRQHQASDNHAIARCGFRSRRRRRIAES